MAPSRIRLTTTTRLVLDALLDADPGDPPWGYRLCEITGLGPGTVYPILERLETAGWVAGTWEHPKPDDRPARRTYTVTGTGRLAYAEAKAAKAHRQTARFALRPRMEA
ncbi:PadR family transcriptional regulator [Glycomyces mayteni]|uniref:PadR family transcriptional regulator n=1 Tax=Glycomyces mayteni TaxID=543887 RepID=A0ABW2D8W0_9ACTN|nr:hypothetical protein GCM10025732_30030 [Glycomyces mayteni]